MKIYANIYFNAFTPMKPFVAWSIQLLGQFVYWYLEVTGCPHKNRKSTHALKIKTG